MTQQSARKVRGFVIDQQTGTPIPNVVLLFEAKATDNNVTMTFRLGMLVTDSAGYASFDLTPFDIKLPKTIQVTPLGEEQSQGSINADLGSQPASRIHFVLKVHQNRVKRTTNVGLASIQNPDDIDREVSPYSFAVKSALTLGEGDCQTPIPTPFALRDFRFGRVVLTTNQSVDSNLPGITALDSTGGFWATDSITLQLRVAEVLEFRQRWFPLGHSLGQIVYSVPLAPCESVNLAMIDWSREDTIRREDHIQARESLFHDQRRDRTIEDTVSAALKESQTGFSLMGGHSHADSAGASATVPIYGIPVNLNAAASNLWSLGGAIAHTNGSRDITADSLQELHDRVRQATSVVRTLNSTVVIQATQQEQNVIQTRTVTNHNHCHALTVQYYEVLRTFKIVTEFERRRRVVLIPYKMVSFGPSDWQLALRFETLLKAVLLDQSLAGCFEAIKRLHLCSQLYTLTPSGPGRTGTQPGVSSSAPSKTEVGWYEITLKSGKGGYSTTSGDIWVEILHGGAWKEIFHKDSVRNGGKELEKGTFSMQVDTTGRPDIAVEPAAISRVRVRWREDGDLDHWDFKGITVTYGLRNIPGSHKLIDKEGGTVPTNSKSGDTALKWFDDSGRGPNDWQEWADDSLMPEEIDEDKEIAKTPPEEEPSRIRWSKEEDECCEQRLLAHLNCNIGYYNRAIWLLQDPVERRILLEELLAGTGLTDLIDEMPVAVSGRYVAFPFDDPQLENVLLKPAVQEALSRLRLGQDVLNDIWNRAVEIGPHEPKKPEPLVSYVSLPTRGLFAEAQLGHCNSCEVRDATRFWKWDESPCEKAPSIEGITPGPKGQPPTIPQPASLPNPVVNVMQAPTAPDPVGLAAALKVLGTPDIFRDMSGLDEVSKLLGQLTSGAVTSLQNAQKIAKEAQDRLTKEKEKAFSAGGGGAEQKQTPEERFDNLQVAKEAAKAAQELGWDNRRTADITSDIVSGDSRPSVQPVVFGREDVEEAQRYAPLWADLLRFEVPSTVATALGARNMSVQGFADAIGDLNLDLYPVKIATLPTISNTPVDAKDLLRHIRLNFNAFIDTGKSEFLPYTPGTDDTKWASSSPLGAVFKIDIPGPDNAAVVGSLVEEHRWRFTTVHTEDTGSHPVSGNREWGFRQTENGELIFYTRGADRSTQAPETMFDFLTFRGGDELWLSFQRKLVDFVNANHGMAVPLDRFSRRFKWTVVRILLGLADRTYTI